MNALPPPDDSAGAAGALSIEHGLQRCLGKVDLYRKIAARFVDTQAQAAAAMAAQLDAGLHLQAARRAHSLISSAGTLGADRLSDMARLLQHSLEAGDATLARAELATLAHEQGVVVALLQAYLQSGA
jgi:HPt (histidine-containing phosphotransfer) domain-containing protein